MVNAGWRRSRTIWCTIRHTHEHRSYSSLWRLWKQFASKKDWGFEFAPFTSRMHCLTPAYYENCCQIRMIDRLFDHSQCQWDTKCTDKHCPDTHCPLVFPLTVQNSSAGVSKWDVLWQLSVNINIFGLHILFRSSSFGACLGPFSFIWKCCKKFSIANTLVSAQLDIIFLAVGCILISCFSSCTCNLSALCKNVAYWFTIKINLCTFSDLTGWLNKTCRILLCITYLKGKEMEK